MKRKRIKNKVLMVFLGVAVCLQLSVAYADPRSTFQSSEFHTFPGDPLPTTSGGTLTRSGNRIVAQLAFHGLDPDSAYSVWWVLFNRPLLCTDGGPGVCGGSDLGGAAQTAVINATGFVTGGSGSANVTAVLAAKMTPLGKQGDPVGIRYLKAFRVEVHMIVKSHGPVLGGAVGAAISTGGGGCNIPVPDSDPPEFMCEDQLGIAFLATK